MHKCYSVVVCIMISGSGSIYKMSSTKKKAKNKKAKYKKARKQELKNLSSKATPYVEKPEEKVIVKEKGNPLKMAFLIILKILTFVGVTLVMAVFLIYGVLLVVMKGPSEHAKEVFVLSARESSVGGILADIVLSPEEIERIASSNQVEDTNEVSDLSLVTIEHKETSLLEDKSAEENDDNMPKVTSEYDVSVNIENGIEFHEIQGATFRGIMAVVYDPSRVFVGTSVNGQYTGAPGKKLMAISDKYDALLSVNGAFFEDTDGFGDGSIPLGHVFSEGVQCTFANGVSHRMMGFTNEDVLVCGNMTGKQAVEMGIRDGVSCNPYLVINGEGVELAENSGLNPRTAIGQRADGMVLMLVVDGRQSASLGASMVDLRDVMLSFGAVNAGNLDGGGSTVMYYENEVINSVASVAGIRPIPNAICVRR